jgi:hypothetical protein
MSATKTLWGQMLLVGAVVIAFIWPATESTAWRLGLRSQLGHPWFELLGRRVRQASIIFCWWFAHDAGGIAAITVAIAISVWLAREVKRVTTYGSARRSAVREVRQAGLLDAHGVLLGRWRREYAALREEVAEGTERRERAEFDPLSLPRRGQLTFGKSVDALIEAFGREEGRPILLAKIRSIRISHAAPDASLICDSPNGDDSYPVVFRDRDRTPDADDRKKTQRGLVANVSSSASCPLANMVANTRHAANERPHLRAVP